jgi:hypothetical protein
VDFQEEFLRLAGGGAADEDGLSGMEVRMERGLESGDGGLTPLAGAIEKGAFEGRRKYLALSGMKAKTRERLGESNEIGGVRQFGQG